MTLTSGGADNLTIDTFGSQPKISVDRTVFSEAEMRSLLSLEVETTIGRPDLCEIRILQSMDQQGTPADDVKESWKPGAALEVDWAGAKVFTGEITSVDFEGGTSRSTEIVLLAFDKRHRMYRTDTVKVFKDSSFKEIVTNLLGALGLQHDLSGLPTTPMKYYLHDGTAGDLVDRLCDRYGLYCLSQGGKVVVKKSADLTEDAGILRTDTHLLEYRCRQTTSADRTKAEVRGWDPKAKKAIVGRGARSAALPAGGLVNSVDTKSAFSESVLRHTSYVGAQKEADEVAVGSLAGNVDAGIQLDGTAIFSPKLAAGRVVKLEALPARFAGKYRLTSVRHRYDLVEGGRSTIVCRGADDTTLSGLLEQAALGGTPAGALSVGYGLQPAIVTNVKSSTGEGALGADGAAGEVKVQLPWLGDDIESGWLRVVTVGGGKDRGFMVMPEVNDEVLVAFHDGDTRSGYVLGGLYNGKDAAPRSAATLTDGSVIQERVWRSRAGHEIVFGDKDKAEYVEIKSSDKKMTIRLDVAEQMIKISSDVDVFIAAKGDIGIEGEGAIGVTAKKTLLLEGEDVRVVAKKKATLKGLEVSVEANAAAEVKGAKVDINSQGPATVKGNPIMLN